MSNVRSLNRVILVGRVGRDPEITHIPNLGKDVAKFSLATSEGYMDKNQQWQDITEWHNIVAWDWNAKKVERSISKGTMVLIEGKLKTRKWQDKESGQERRATEIIAENLTPLEKSNKTSSYPAESGSGEQVPPGPGANNFYSQQRGSGPQAPPEVQINSDMPYDESGDPF
jgi:single-strand DNA-binding protein